MKLGQHVHFWRPIVEMSHVKGCKICGMGEFIYHSVLFLYELYFAKFCLLLTFWNEFFLFEMSHVFICLVYFQNFAADIWVLISNFWSEPVLKISFFRCGSLRPSSQKVLSLVAELKTLQKNNETLEKDKEHLRINLLSAEEEVRRA